MPNETEEAFEARRAIAQQGMADVQKMINELESITVGLNIDQTRQSVYFDFGITAKEGTETAKQFAHAGHVHYLYIPLTVWPDHIPQFQSATLRYFDLVNMSLGGAIFADG